jgi:hypothetical protein
MIFDLSNSQREIWGSSCQHHTVLMLAELTPFIHPFQHEWEGCLLRAADEGRCCLRRLVWSIWGAAAELPSTLRCINSHLLSLLQLV